MERFVKTWDLVVEVVVVLAGILLWVQMIIVNIEVVARYFGRPTTWVTEVSSLLILWIPFMATAWVLKNEGHVRMDLILDRFSPSTQAMVNCITSLVGVVVMFVVAIAGVMTTIDSIGYRTPTTLMLPKAPLIAIIPVGSFMFAIQFFLRAVINFNKWKAAKSGGTIASEKVGAAS
jgi:TRAP-type C4-dicarboxylate transport system permease small subunit